MTKQEHIEAVEQVIWSWLQSHYQESCYTTELGKFTDALCDFWKIYNDNKDEIKQLKAENEELSKVVSSKVYDLIDNAKEIADAREAWEKQAKIDAMNELKEKIVEHMGTREYMGVKYKQGVFSESEIDEMIAEVQNAEDKS